MLVAVQLALVGAAGVLLALGLPIWAFVDERAHAAYVAEMGAGQLPVLAHALIPHALATVGGSPTGLAAQSYEAFQPPLYYAVMAGPWDVLHALGGTGLAVRGVRILDLALLAAGLWLLWLLARRAAPSRSAALAAFAVALAFVCWPGVVFRAVTISNLALEVPLTSAMVLAAWIAWSEESAPAALGAAVLCGLGLLCRLPFPPVVLIPMLAWRFRARAPRVAMAVVLVPVLFIVPWLADNLHRYGGLSAAAVVRDMQGGFLNPSDRPYGLGRLLHADGTLLNGILPEEWANTTLLLYASSHSLPLAVLHVLRGALAVLVAGVLAVWLAERPQHTWLLVAPFLAGLVLMQIETVIVRLPLIQPRYVYPSLPVLALAGGLALVHAGRVRAALVTSAVLTTLLVGLWLYLWTVPTLRGG